VQGVITALEGVPVPLSLPLFLSLTLSKLDDVERNADDESETGNDQSDDGNHVLVPFGGLEIPEYHWGQLRINHAIANLFNLRRRIAMPV
jgi:hypothetical protein